jgi:hypothetical protein
MVGWSIWFAPRASWLPTGTGHARSKRHDALGPRPASGPQPYDTPKSRLLVEVLVVV